MCFNTLFCAKHIFNENRVQIDVVNSVDRLQCARIAAKFHCDAVCLYLRKSLVRDKEMIYQNCQIIIDAFSDQNVGL